MVPEAPPPVRAQEFRRSPAWQAEQAGAAPWDRRRRRRRVGEAQARRTGWVDRATDLLMVAWVLSLTTRSLDVQVCRRIIVILIL